MQVYQAIAQLRQSSPNAHKVFVEYLNQLRDNEINSALNADDPKHIYRAQGANKLLHQLNDVVAHPEKYIKQLKESE